MDKTDTTEDSSRILSPGDLAKLAGLLKEQAGKVARQIPALGAVSWLMAQQNATRHTLLSELQWRVMPALVLDQAKLYLREGLPLAFVSWARLSPEVVERYREKPHHLIAADWQSGEQVWIVDLLAPYGGTEEVIKDLKEKVFPGKDIFQLLPREDSAAQTVNWAL